MKLKLTDIREDPEVQLRRLDMDRVIAMVEYEEQGGHLPPITVVGDDNLLGDGHHRLAAARRAGKTEIEAERVPGGKDEAIVTAIQMNDVSSKLPVTRTERNEGVKYLLKAGWTQERIGKAAGIDPTMIGDTQTALAARGEVKTRPSRGKAGGRPPKGVAVLPKAVASKLGDTVLVRIATLPEDQQVEFATAVAAVPNKKYPTMSGLPESRVREAVKLLNAGGLTPTQAVEMATPQGREMPKTLPDVAKQVRKRLERFLTEPMTVEGTERDFWAVIDVLAHNATRIPLEAKGLATLLSEVAVKADHYASALRRASGSDQSDG